jgi:hypothetical protein
MNRECVHSGRQSSGQRFSQLRAVKSLIGIERKHTNTGWILQSTPPNWKFLTSNSGWTSDSHAFEWLTTLFDPETRRLDEKRRLLILDGHGSHLTARFIAFCLDAHIDLVCLPPHTSHKLQPLDVSLFGPLKRALQIQRTKKFYQPPPKTNTVRTASSRALICSWIQLAGTKNQRVIPLQTYLIPLLHLWQILHRSLAKRNNPASNTSHALVRNGRNTARPTNPKRPRYARQRRLMG